MEHHAGYICAMDSYLTRPASMQLRAYVVSCVEKLRYYAADMRASRCICIIIFFPQRLAPRFDFYEHYYRIFIVFIMRSFSFPFVSLADHLCVRDRLSQPRGPGRAICSGRSFQTRCVQKLPPATAAVGEEQRTAIDVS